MTGRYQDADRPVGSFALIDLEEPFAERVRGYTDDGVDVGVEVAAATQRLDGNGLLPNLVLFTHEMFFADEPEHAGEVRGTAQHTGGEQPVELFLFSLGCIEYS